VQLDDDDDDDKHLSHLHIRDKNHGALKQFIKVC